MDQQDYNVDSIGRIFTVTVYGDTPEELEMTALDRAREFFGPDVRLELIRKYSVSTEGYSRSDKKYVSTITVKEVLEP